MAAETDDKYAKASADRDKYVAAVLASAATKKVVVAGPGTGKTHLFEQILHGKQNTLTLTFVNSLVEDLSLDLCGLSEVRTLHGFARSQLQRAGENVRLFPKLSEVISEDSQILLGAAIAFDPIFHNREDGSKHLPFYLGRREFYSHYGYTDIIWTLVQRFEKDGKQVPVYQQILVDEFQDFNSLEVSLIELLATKSPILLAGDDDQALYDFKSASTEHIRDRHSNAKSGYAPFTLPYCSRCTRTIVEAVNDIIAQAIKRGSLKGRVDKKYIYFEASSKDKECAANPKIVCSQIFESQIAWYIEKNINALAKEVRKKFQVLVISPYRAQSTRIANALKERGFENVESDGPRDDRTPTLVDGLTVLRQDKTSNLGWRVACKHLLSEDEFSKLLKSTQKDTGARLQKSVPVKHKKAIEKLLGTFRAMQSGKDVDRHDLEEFLTMVGIDHYKMATDTLRKDFERQTQRKGDASTRKIPISTTTIQGSKGLAAEYVFITHCDDRYFIKGNDKDKPSDQDICNFLVAVTRARRRVYLISTDKTRKCTFMNWIAPDRLDF